MIRWLSGGVAAVVVVVLLLLAPSAYVELACRADPVASEYEPILPPEHRRAEARTLLTYPEWHIIYAYDDYAAVIAAGDPHEFDFLRAVAGFWTSFCALSREADRLGTESGGSRQTVPVIGVSFTAEMLLKALYEETAGRLAYAAFGRGPLDDLSARQAMEYARFLRQVPWYRWDFRADAAELRAAATEAGRDRERAFALGVEYGAKAAYAGVIEGAVATTGADALRLRSVVTGADAATLSAIEDVTVIGPLGPGFEIETPRYAAFTALLPALARSGAVFAEIAGNDEILLTLTAPEGAADALRTLPRQGYGDVRSLVLLPVGELLAFVRANPGGVEHVHDY